MQGEPLQHTEHGFLRAVTTFGTAVDITAAEPSIEAFLPADAHTAEVVRALTEAGGNGVR